MVTGADENRYGCLKPVGRYLKNVYLAHGLLLLVPTIYIFLNGLNIYILNYLNVLLIKEKKEREASKQAELDEKYKKNWNKGMAQQQRVSSRKYLCQHS